MVAYIIPWSLVFNNPKHIVTTPKFLTIVMLLQSHYPFIHWIEFGRLADLVRRFYKIVSLLDPRAFLLYL